VPKAPGREPKPEWTTSDRTDLSRLAHAYEAAEARWSEWVTGGELVDASLTAALSAVDGLWLRGEQIQDLACSQLAKKLAAALDNLAGPITDAQNAETEVAERSPGDPARAQAVARLRTMVHRLGDKLEQIADLKTKLGG
jgi:hypothetical protein